MLKASSLHSESLQDPYISHTTNTSDLYHIMSEIWRFTVDNTNPLLRYLPYGTCPINELLLSLKFQEGDGSPARGWQAWYDSSGDPVSCGKSSVDGSYHFTSYPGASLELKFSGMLSIRTFIAWDDSFIWLPVGTEILLYGHANCSYDVRVDNSSYHYTESIPNILFYKKGLHPSTHVVNLTAHPAASQEFVFDRAVVGDATMYVLSYHIPHCREHHICSETWAWSLHGCLITRIWTPLYMWGHGIQYQIIKSHTQNTRNHITPQVLLVPSCGPCSMDLPVCPWPGREVASMVLTI